MPAAIEQINPRSSPAFCILAWERLLHFQVWERADKDSGADALPSCLCRAARQRSETKVWEMNSELFWALPGCGSALLPMPGVFRPSTAVFFWKERGENERSLHLTIQSKQNSVPQWARPQNPIFLQVEMTKKKIQCGEMLNTTRLYPALPLAHLPQSPGAEGQDECEGQPPEILKVIKQDSWNTLLGPWSWHCSLLFPAGFRLVQAGFFSSLSASLKIVWLVHEQISLWHFFCKHTALDGHWGSSGLSSVKGGEKISVHDYYIRQRGWSRPFLVWHREVNQNGSCSCVKTA